MPSLLIPSRFIFILVVIGVILIGIFFHPNKTVLISVSFVAAITGLSLLAISLRGKRFDEDERLHREFLTLTMQKFLNDLEREGPTKFTSHHLMRAIKNSSTMLGKGGYGSVHKGKFSDGTEVAVKVLHGGISDKRMEEQFMAEVRTIGRVRHFNLVRLLGFCIEEDMTALVYECMENGSLHKYLSGKNEMTLAFEKLYDIAIGTAKGIAYLHEGCQERIIHYDIKPGNILLDHNFCPKVADFGLAKLCDRERSHISMTGQRGTFGYVAPELSNLSVTYKCDVYSFGMLLFKIIESFDMKSEEWFPLKVWKKCKSKKLEELIIDCGIEDKDKERVERMIKIALWCIQQNPELRPKMSDVVKMLEGSINVQDPSKSNPSIPSWMMETNHGSEAPKIGTSTASGSSKTASKPSNLSATPII